MQILQVRFLLTRSNPLETKGVPWRAVESWGCLVVRVEGIRLSVSLNCYQLHLRLLWLVKSTWTSRMDRHRNLRHALMDHDTQGNCVGMSGKA